MSGRHARLCLDGGQFRFEDVGSKNGSLVNHQKQQRAVLSDGDVLELGSTFFLYRAAVPVGSEPLDHAPSSKTPAGLSSLAPALHDRFDQLGAIARSQVSVLVLGESGTGKELVARAVHDLSARRGPFVAVNCGGIPANLVESELFGFRKGAFSGANEDRTGLVRASSGGTLFLDEIGDLPAAAQAALLRVLQAKDVMAVGSTQAVPVDLRVVAATHRDLARLVTAERFRADLLARLNGFELRLPPLRERREDMGVILASLSDQIGRTSSSRVTFSPEAMRALLRYQWPLNVRELEQCITAAAALGRGRVLLQNLPEKVQRPERIAGTPIARELSSDEAERRDGIVELLQKHRGNIAAVARAMGKDRAQIHRWLKAYAIDLDRFRR